MPIPGELGAEAPLRETIAHSFHQNGARGSGRVPTLIRPPLHPQSENWMALRDAVNNALQRLVENARFHHG